MIQVPPQSSQRETRPSKAQLRQALFNSLQFSLPDAKVLDLFSGSGCLGFEALSRGAASVVFVEDSPAALKTLKENIRTLKVEELTRVMATSVAQVTSALIPHLPFDLILADPPYADGWELRLLNEMPWDQWLTPNGTFALEWGLIKSKFENLPDETGFLVKTREKLYGDSGLTFYRRKD